MKKKIIIILVIAFILFTCLACKKENKKDPKVTYDGPGSAIVDYADIVGDE